MVFCRTYKEKRRKKSHRKLTGDLTFTFFENTLEINPEEWAGVLHENNFFLTLNYLSLIQKLHAGPMACRYILVYKNGVPVFVAYFQVIDFTADVFGDLVESQISELQSKRLKLFGKYVNKYKDHVVMRLVTCGNNFVSGEHGFAYSDKIKKDEAFSILAKITEIVSKEEKLRGTIAATLIKDFYTDRLPKTKTLEKNKFVEFTVEPNMIVKIPGNVENVTDYIGTFSKKYRNRAKGILKAGAQLVKKDLSAGEIKKHTKQLYKLYENVFSNAKFKLVKLAENYFYEIKLAYPERFFVTAYYLEEQLIGFDSAFVINAHTLEAHYIGLDYDANKKCELYQNILYHFIEIAIAHKKKHLDLGRTASEIKSTVGAKAHELVCYIKPQNTLSQLILKPFISFLQPTEWIPRNPFKEE